MELIKKNTEEALKGIKSLYNFYIGAFSIFLLRGIIRDVGQFLGASSEKNSGVFEILNFVVPKNHFSLIFGILFGVFIVLLIIKINYFKDLIIKLPEYRAGDFCQYINYYHWLTSPFGQFKWRY
jgi:hypothetical protein